MWASCFLGNVTASGKQVGLTESAGQRGPVAPKSIGLLQTVMQSGDNVMGDGRRTIIKPPLGFNSL
jgi:hypothetical protein